MAGTSFNSAELSAAAAAASDAKTRLTYLFDDGKYTELDAYAVNGDKLSGVITAFGYTDGNPCYAFSQDVSVNKGALNKAQADKIVKLYDLAAKTGVPVVGIYDSCGADLTDGAEALTAYGELLMWMSNLSGVVPQIAVIAGVCCGTAAIMAESADIAIICKDAQLYNSPNADISSSSENALKNGTAALAAENDEEAMKTAKQLLARLPMNNLSPIPVYEFEQPAEQGTSPEAIADGGSLCELYAEYGNAAYTAFATVGGSSVGIVSTNRTADKLNADDCSKIARFVRLCDAFAVPVVTLVDTEGFEGGTASEAAGAVKSMAKLAHAYAEATTAKISAVVGKACGAGFITLAGKGANADLSYAVDSAVITALVPATAAEFFYHDELKGAEDLKAKRLELAAKYAVEEGSPVLAAAKGCIDGVVPAAALRSTIISGIEILAGKRVSRLPKKHGNIQL